MRNDVIYDSIAMFSPLRLTPGCEGNENYLFSYQIGLDELGTQQWLGPSGGRLRYLGLICRARTHVVRLQYSHLTKLVWPLHSYPAREMPTEVLL